MSDVATQSTGFQPPAFWDSVREMVDGHAPRVFAVVVEFGEQIDAQIIAWGMSLASGTFMTTLDGRNHYSLSEPENALKYIVKRTNVTSHIVWVGGVKSE
nr:hypothetical protein [Kibdelosporangium sp. MJ126-NF4]CEL20766.1 hypothetical protein [Kibdelosporangium sp. MJ126-NF4]CTQ89679.1 hypothetical protein [Kibdelosporangium sp. MJ126-NF4]